MKSEPSLTTRPISTMLYRDEEGPKGIHHYVDPDLAWDEDSVAWTPPTSFGPPLFVTFLISWALGVVIFMPIVLAIAALEAAP